MKKPDLRLFVAVLKTLSEQGFIDVRPTEAEYDLTLLYHFLVETGIAGYVKPKKYWIYLTNPDACEKMIRLLEEAQPDVLLPVGSGK